MLHLLRVECGWCRLGRRRERQTPNGSIEMNTVVMLMSRLLHHLRRRRHHHQSIITCLDRHHVTVGRRENRIVVFMRVYVESSSFVLVVTTATSSNGAHINTPIYIYIYTNHSGRQCRNIPNTAPPCCRRSQSFFGPHNLRQTAPHVTKIVT